MTEFGYHASHEQFPPDELRDLARRAEDRGFDGVLASDHFHPWSERQGNAGHVWSWLGGAMEATTLSFGTVNAPGYRYHPTVVAQAVATLSRMYPDRFWLAVGSGEFVNEHVTGEAWPIKEKRNDRLRECVEIMRRLWDGETVTHEGEVTVQAATLYTRPERRPPVVGAALSEETARWQAGWADGMITVATPDLDQLEAVVGAFRERAPDKPVYAKAQLSYDEDEGSAMEGAYDQWRTNAVPGPVTQNLRTTDQFDAVGETITEEQVAESVHVAADFDDHVEWLRELAALGVDRVYLHNVNRRQERFVDEFADAVLPKLNEL